MSPASNTVRAISSGAGPALLAAVLFGASTPLAKLLLRGMDPWMLAGVLYLGSGLGLEALRIVTAAGSRSRIEPRTWLRLGAAIVAGGVVAPVLLMTGLARSQASTAALLLNLEGVFTVLLARFVLREHVSRRITVGMASIVAGGVALTVGGHAMAGGWLGPAAIAAACLGWAIDSNLTRQVSAMDPVSLAMFKGGAAGATNVVIARWLGSAWPGPGTLAAAGLVGFLGYGISLVLFVVALRGIGVARTAAYFSLVPFFGSAIAVLLLRDPITPSLVVAGVLMAMGLWLNLTEYHEHVHEHFELPQESGRASGHEPQPPRDRRDREPVWHSHPHYPDIHHRHDH
ncbi:MAG TPA: DMT family transporter [Candidatus Methylomirabilis sp.]|nr:DMT family transporter [Candidatus Methylomirabilis sp.]